MLKDSKIVILYLTFSWDITILSHIMTKYTRKKPINISKALESNLNKNLERSKLNWSVDIWTIMSVNTINQLALAQWMKMNLFNWTSLTYSWQVKKVSHHCILYLYRMDNCQQILKILLSNSSHFQDQKIHLFQMLSIQ